MVAWSLIGAIKGCAEVILSSPKFQKTLNIFETIWLLLIIWAIVNSAFLGAQLFEGWIAVLAGFVAGMVPLLLLWLVSFLLRKRNVTNKPEVVDKG